jgi:hypothetical protein
LARRAKQSSPSGVTFQQLESAENRIPVYSELHRFLLANGIAEKEMDGEISRFAIRASGHSRQAMQHAWALKRLAERFSEEELRTLDPAARKTWIAMIQLHAAAIERETGALNQELSPIFFSGVASSNPSDQGDISTDTGLLQSVGRLFNLCASVDKGVRSAFAVSSDASAGDDIKASGFRQSLESVKQLASKIAGKQN